MKPQQGEVKLVYRPKTQEEGERRAARAEALVGTPFIQLPGEPDQHNVLFVHEGHKARVEHVEMVFNDMLLMDAISNWGEDGPLYENTDMNPFQRAVLDYAKKAYEGVEIPEALRPPEGKKEGESNG